MGNVLVTISDIKIPHDYNANSVVDYYTADIINAQDYYPFGSIMPSRNWSNEEYRFGFNGMEKDNEVKGEGNSLDFGARIYDSRLGRWMSLDPLAEKYLYETPFCFVGNSPIVIVDPDGKEKIVVIGQPGNHNNKDNFTITALDRAKKLKNEVVLAARGTVNTVEQVTMLLYVSTDAEQIAEGFAYSPEQVKSFQKQADAARINSVIVHSSEEVVNYVNTKNKDISINNELDLLNSSRDGDLITNFTWVGHSGVNDAGLGLDYTKHFNDEGLLVKNFSGLAFSDDCDAHLENGCNTLNPLVHSQGDDMISKVGGYVYGSTAKTDFSGTSKNNILSEEDLQDGKIEKVKGVGGKSNTIKAIVQKAVDALSAVEN